MMRVIWTVGDCFASTGGECDAACPRLCCWTTVVADLCVKSRSEIVDQQTSAGRLLRVCSDDVS